jgi:hypothetical protein
MPTVHFLEGETWEGWRHAVMFHAQTDAQQLIVCLVPSQTLRDRFGAVTTQQADLINAFRCNRSQIEEIARRLIEAGRFETDGSIVIHRADV